MKAHIARNAFAACALLVVVAGVPAQAQQLSPSYRAWWDSVLYDYCTLNPDAMALPECTDFLDYYECEYNGICPDGPSGSDVPDDPAEEGRDDPFEQTRPCELVDAGGERCIALALERYFPVEVLDGLDEQELLELAAEYLSPDELEALHTPARERHDSPAPDPRRTNAPQ